MPGRGYKSGGESVGEMSANMPRSKTYPWLPMAGYGTGLRSGLRVLEYFETRNLAIANRSRVSCTYKVTTASSSPLLPSKVTQSHLKRHGSIILLTESDIILRMLYKRVYWLLSTNFFVISCGLSTSNKDDDDHDFLLCFIVTIWPYLLSSQILPNIGRKSRNLYTGTLPVTQCPRRPIGISHRCLVGPYWEN